MATEVELKSLAHLYHFTLGQYQSFSMCFTDAAAQREGFTLIYGLDGYDLSTYLLPSKLFAGEADPFRDAVLARWHTFFRHARPNQERATVSPLTLFELLRMLQHTTAEDALSRAVREQYQELLSLVDRIANGSRSLQEVAEVDIRRIRELYLRMRSAKVVNQVLRDRSLFADIRPLITDGRICLWDSVIERNVRSLSIDDLFSFDSTRISHAVSYLSDKRSGRDLSYSLLDILNYVLYDNIHRTPPDQEPARIYITSSGVLSRNAWYIAKYGALIGHLEAIPDDWAARAADVPSYLVRAREHFGNDLIQMIDFLEEGKTLCRVILRDLLATDELNRCATDRREREKLYRTNPRVKIRNAVGQAMMRFQNDYYRIIAPEVIEQLTPSPEIPNEAIDVVELLDWMQDSRKRGLMYQESVTMVRDEIRQLELIPVGWHSYVAPLGEEALEIMQLYAA